MQQCPWNFDRVDIRSDQPTNLKPNNHWLMFFSTKIGTVYRVVNGGGSKIRGFPNIP